MDIICQGHVECSHRFHRLHNDLVSSKDPYIKSGRD